MVSEFPNLFASKRIDSIVYILHELGALGNFCTCASWGKFLQYDTIEIQKAILLHKSHVLKKIYPLEQFYENISWFIGALKF